METIKNCEGSQIIYYLPSNKSTFYSFLSAGRKHKTTESEKKGILLPRAIVVAKVSESFFCWFLKLLFAARVT